MDALPFVPIELTAIDPARNLRRRWRVAVMYDLFGHLVVETGWGRIGAHGRTLTRSFTSEVEALAYVRALLRRRSEARRRIGVAYTSACR
ncbi:hypothetical protein ASE75_14845 [Sphingomonas sp. Leaf17]|uniref:WGR domain-containing protein n=1 Tax=Sphingomonas sp. Leaf17 TaxID=1735683 RepID=UPI000700314E|nr:WGR domain-containing protein [Sphingomonas sp. Leaf17]KQM62013.1 hypothetical protein ASE75_14845 [Sphingomonas sp. Leaf17]